MTQEQRLASLSDGVGLVFFPAWLHLSWRTGAQLLKGPDLSQSEDCVQRAASRGLTKINS